MPYLQGGYHYEQAMETIFAKTEEWKDSLLWLKDTLGDFGAGQMIEPSCLNRVNDDGGDFLSIDCTLGYLMKQEAAKNILELYNAKTSYFVLRREAGFWVIRSTSYLFPS